MKSAAEAIFALGPKCVIVKGGKIEGEEKAVDVVYSKDGFMFLEENKIDTTFTHGAGCTFSAAIAAELAKGTGLKDAIKIAKAFITEAIKHSFKLNQYVGPTNHGAYRNIK